MLVEEGGLPDVDAWVARRMVQAIRIEQIVISACKYV